MTICHFGRSGQPNPRVADVDHLPPPALRRIRTRMSTLIFKMPGNGIFEAISCEMPLQKH
jgi:hypothetical protein